MYGSIPYLFLFISYFIYFFFPLPLPISNLLPWNYSVSILVAIIIAIPAFTLMGLGVRAAGEETFRPKKEHKLYGGIYNKIRHPQSLGEVWTGIILGLILNSTFLLLYSFLWFPVFYYMVVVEERDLILRYGESYVEYKNRVGMFIPKRTTKTT